MSRWIFEAGHTAAEFCVKHMMVTYVRGHFKNVHGTLEFAPGSPALSRVEAVIDTRGLWSGEPDRDAHLKSPDFLDVGRFPEITFRGSQVRLRGPTEAVVIGDLTHSRNYAAHRTPGPVPGAVEDTVVGGRN
jgi:polyisoprenoid-binding protein YceI